MPPKRRPRRIPAQETSDEGASDECASKKVDQWVVGIVAGARDGDGNEYYLVRWGADDKGKPFDVGMEEETWEPSAHVQGCPDALNKFYEASRPPLPSEKDAMESEMQRQVAQLTTPGQSRRGEAGAHASLPTDVGTDFLCSELEVDRVTDSIKQLGDKTLLLSGETISSSPRSPAVLTPSHAQHDPYEEGTPDDMHPEVAEQRGRGQLRAGALDFAGVDLKLDEGSGMCATPSPRRAQQPET